MFSVHQIPSWWLREYIVLSYYHHQIGGVNYYPLFRVRSWNNGMRCMSFYILTPCVCIAMNVSPGCEQVKNCRFSVKWFRTSMQSNPRMMWLHTLFQTWPTCCFFTFFRTQRFSYCIVFVRVAYSWQYERGIKKQQEQDFNRIYTKYAYCTKNSAYRSVMIIELLLCFALSDKRIYLFTVA